MKQLTNEEHTPGVASLHSLVAHTQKANCNNGTGRDGTKKNETSGTEEKTHYYIKECTYLPCHFHLCHPYLYPTGPVSLYPTIGSRVNAPETSTEATRTYSLCPQLY